MRHDDAVTRPSAPDIRRVGDRALLVDVGSLAPAMSWHRRLTAAPLRGQVEVVAAAQTVLVRFDSSLAAEAAVTSLRSLTPESAAPRSMREHVLDVVYDGDDLAETARLVGVSPEGLVDAHVSHSWQVAFGGFAPGFAYCVPADGSPHWDVPRLAEPRTGVPPGSVGLAGQFSAVYPRRSPGGWRLIGRTAATLWNAEEDPPALLAPGDRLRYRAVRNTIALTASSRPTATAPATTATAATAATTTATAATTTATPSVAAVRSVLRVDVPGLLTLIQDRGRPGRGDMGVSPSGFADRASAHAANHTVGNPPDAALLEVMGDARFTCLADVVVAIAGAAGNDTVTPQLLRAGDVLRLDPDPRLARSYLAVRGGLATTTEVGSASADVLSGLGPDLLLTGAEVAVPTRSPTRSVEHGRGNPAWARTGGGGAAAEGGAGTGTGIGTDVTLRVVLGPRDDWFSPQEIERFTSLVWTVEAQSNRVGIRLAPREGEPALVRDHNGELPSEGTVTGTVQVPANGLPVVFGPDRPVTGGYPAIATVIDDDLDLVAQVPHGARVRFHVIAQSGN